MILRGEGFAPVLNDVLGQATVERVIVELVADNDAVWKLDDGMVVATENTLELRLGAVEVSRAGEYQVVVSRGDASVPVEGSLTLVVAPTVESVDSGLDCSQSEGRRLVTIRGAGFRVEPNGSVTVTIGDTEVSATGRDCDDMMCDELALELVESALPPGTYDVEVADPTGEGCGVSAPASLSIVDVTVDPSLDGLTPSVVCGGSPFDLELTGSGFATLEGAVASASIGGDLVPLSLRDCDSQGGFDVCNTATATWAAPSVTMASDSPVTVTNPASTCDGRRSSTEDVRLLVLPSPAFGELAEPVLCTSAEAGTAMVTGGRYFRTGDVGPEFAIEGESVSGELGGCEPVPERPSVEICTTVALDLAAVELPPGDVTLTVSQPGLAGCRDDQATLLLTGPPTISGHTPELTDGFAGPLTLQGTGFLRSGDVLPEVSVNGVAAVVDEVTGCTALQGTEGIETCSGLVVSNLPPVGSFLIEVNNPAPGNCGAVTYGIQYADEPLVVAAEPGEICSTGGDIEVSGEGFIDPVIAQLGNVRSDASSLSDGLVRFTWQSIDDELTEETEASLVVTNETPTTFFEFPQPITVFPTPRFVQVFPRAYPPGFPVPITATFDNVRARRVDAVNLVTSTNHFDDPVHTAAPLLVEGFPDEVRFVMPQDATADLRPVLVDEWNCRPIGATVNATSGTLNVFEPTPNLAHVDQPRNIRIVEDQTASFGSQMLVYAYAVGEPMRLLQPVSSNTIEVRVSTRGLPAGVYDLVVVDVDRQTHDVLPASLTIVDDPLPLITNVSPMMLPYGSIVEVVVEGINLGSPEESAVTVRCDALDFSTQRTFPLADLRTSGDDLRGDMVINGAFENSTCFVEVESNGLSTRFVGLWAKASFSQTFTYHDRTDGRFGRGSAGAAADFGPGSRFLYVAGGDSVATFGVAPGDSGMTAVDVRGVDDYGDLRSGEPWRTTADLPIPLYGAGAAVVGDALYVLGGYDGTGTVASVYRAPILREGQGPSLTNVNYHVGASDAGPPSGVWFYRVSALLGPSDPNNPDGETVASVPVSVRVNQPSGARLQPAFEVAPWPNALEYRLYRGLSADPDDMELVAQVSASDGVVIDQVANGDASTTPRREGDLGAFVMVAELDEPRAFFGVTSYDEPGSSTSYIYAVGGLHDSGLHGTYELLEVVVDATGQHTVTSIPPVGATFELQSPRSHLQATVVGAERFSLLSEDPMNRPYLYAIGGLDENGEASGDIDYGPIGNGGLIVGIPSGITMDSPIAAFQLTTGSNSFSLYGGTTGSSSRSGWFFGEVCSGCDFAPDPDFRNGSDTGDEPIDQAASLQIGAVGYSIGGNDGSTLNQYVVYGVAGGAP